MNPITNDMIMHYRDFFSVGGFNSEGQGMRMIGVQNGISKDTEQILDILLCCRNK